MEINYVKLVNFRLYKLLKSILTSSEWGVQLQVQILCKIVCDQQQAIAKALPAISHGESCPRYSCGSQVVYDIQYWREL